MRDDKDFFGGTLAFGDQRLQAHNVILWLYSPLSENFMSEKLLVWMMETFNCVYVRLEFVNWKFVPNIVFFILSRLDL